MRFITEIEACEELASSVILQACDDYFVCKRKINQGKNTATGIANCEKLLAECEEFFHSSQYVLYTHNNPALSGERVMKQIDSMVEDTVNYPNDFSPFRRRMEDSESEEEPEE